MNRVPNPIAPGLITEGERSLDSRLAETKRKGIGGTAGRQPPSRKPSLPALVLLSAS